MEPQVTCVLDAKAMTGESPVWSPEEQALYWVDIPGQSLNRFDPRTGASRTWSMPEPVGSFAFRTSGGLILAMRAGFANFDLATGALTTLGVLDIGGLQNRFNDGRCDPQGRFWAGTMVPRGTPEPGGALYRLDPDHRHTRMLDGLFTSNGLAWSPDGKTMYHADSRRHTVFAYDFDADSGTLSNRRPFIETREGEGRPDGAAVDAEGFYWVAMFDGWRVCRYAPDGRLDRAIRMPVARPTMCAFGGEGLDLLYVTSGSQGLSAEDWQRQPHAGGLFVIPLDVRGLPEPKFRG
jgi:sugar lactone lactonase YvrE